MRCQWCQVFYCLFDQSPLPCLTSWELNPLDNSIPAVKSKKYVLAKATRCNRLYIASKVFQESQLKRFRGCLPKQNAIVSLFFQVGCEVCVGSWSPTLVWALPRFKKSINVGFPTGFSPLAALQHVVTRKALRHVWKTLCRDTLRWTCRQFG